MVNNDEYEDYDSTTELIEAVNSNLLETIEDLSQLNLKSAMLALTKNESILADVPLLKWMISGVQIVSKISVIYSIRKFYAFITPIKDSAIFESKNYKEKLEEICGSKRKLNFVIEQTLFSLDKYDSEIKAKWLAKMFVATFKEKKFSVDEYNAIQFSINFLNPVTSISALEIYYGCKDISYKDGNYDKELDLKRANADFSSLVLSGFLHLPKGAAVWGSTGGASINDLGIRFYENIILG